MLPLNKAFQKGLISKICVEKLFKYNPNSVYQDELYNEKDNYCSIKDIIEPIEYVDKLKLTNNQIEHYTAIGENAIKNGECPSFSTKEFINILKEKAL